NVGLHWKGASPVDFPNLLPSVDILRDVLHLDTAVRFTTKDLLIIVVSLPLVYGLRLFIFRTRLGRAMRATAQDRDTAALMGIDINATITLAFPLAGRLRGTARAR